MKLRTILPAVALSLYGLTAWGVPAYPGLIETRQPDGSALTIRLYGDERFSWARTADGYTLLRDTEGYWTLATQNADGTLAPSRLRPGTTPASVLARGAGIAPMLPLSGKEAPRRAQASNLQVDCSFPTTGKRNLLMLLVNYADTKPTYSRETFDKFMNGTEWKGIGSFRDFYMENSYGKLDIHTTVSPWITMPNNKQFYSEDNVGDIIKYCLETLAAEMDLTQFDNDGDGILDGLAIIHQGAGAEVTGSTADIWSHSSTIYGLSAGGIEVRRYTIEPELLDPMGQMTEIGVMCHEFAHNLGAPDFYDTDYKESGGEYGGTGVWDLLGSGAWNGNYGDRPAHVNMWQKIIFGWVEPELLTETKTVSAMADCTRTAAAYRFDTTSPGDYFIIENRQASGAFNSALPASGLLLTHANEGIIASRVMANTVNAMYPQGCYTVCSSAMADPGEETGTYGYLGGEAAPFGNGAKDGKDAFSDATVPSAHSVDGRYSYCALSDIAINPDGTMRFNFTAMPEPGAPENLQARGEGSDVVLSWDAPKGEDTPTQYNIYRGSEKIASATAATYTDVAPEATGVLTYTVDAQYAGGLVSAPRQVSLRLPAHKVEEMKGIAYEEGVRLDWTLNPVISRMQKPGNVEADYATRDVSGATVEYGHLFSAADMATYCGMKIRRISFIPRQGLQEATFALKVYEGKGCDYQLVSERQLKEMGNGIWNNIMLTKTVEIKPGMDYIVAVELKPIKNVGLLLTENGGVTDGVGNLLRINEGEWTSDNQAVGNYYLYATLSEGEASRAGSLSETGSVENPETDLAFPVGYGIYRDGVKIGMSDTRAYLDAPRPAGKHTYTISTLYRGGSETTPAQATEVDADNVSIDITPAQADGEGVYYRPDGTRVIDPAGAKGILLSPEGKTIR